MGNIKLERERFKCHLPLRSCEALFAGELALLF